MDNQIILDWVIIISVVVFFFIHIESKKSKKTTVTKKEKEPEIYLTETYIGIDVPIPLQCYPDRVVWENGKLLIEDLKNRKYKTVFETDIIQLSVCKYILKRVQKDGEVLEKAKLYIQTPNGMEEKYIDLYSDEKVEELYKRYVSLMNKDIVPREIKNINFCKKCPHYQKYCFPESKK